MPPAAELGSGSIQSGKRQFFLKIRTSRASLRCADRKCLQENTLNAGILLSQLIRRPRSNSWLLSPNFTTTVNRMNPPDSCPRLCTNLGFRACARPISLHTLAELGPRGKSLVGHDCSRGTFGVALKRRSRPVCRGHSRPKARDCHRSQTVLGARSREVLEGPRA